MYIADLHIHSRFSRATSKDGNPENLELWARRKGIDIVGTGDFTHPEWREGVSGKAGAGRRRLLYVKRGIPDFFAVGAGSQAVALRGDGGNQLHL